MSFKGVGGSKRLGIAIGGSIVVHIVALCVFLSIGGGGGGASPSSEPPPLPPPPAEDDYSSRPSPVADDVGVPSRDDTAAAEEAAKAEKAERARAAKEKAAAEAKKAAARREESRRKAEAKANAAMNKVETAVKAAETAKKGDAGRKAETAKTDGDSAPSAPAGEWRNYEVRPGDSLTKIAKKCGITVQELAKANGLKANANLNLGQTIKIKASE